MDSLLLGLVLLFLIASFVLEKLPVEVTAFAALGLLLLFGLVTPEQATAGFSNPAVITVMMMFVLGEGLVQSGALRAVGARLLRSSRKAQGRARSLLLLLAGSVSAFINNTAAVAIFLPLALDIAKRYRINPSKLLLPLSYATIFGGCCTLIGTSTNLLVSALAVEAGMTPFTMFEFFALGGVLFAVGMAFNLTLAPRLLPEREPPSSLTGKYHMGEYLTELTVPAESPLVGRTVLDEELSEHFRIHLLQILRPGRRIVTDLRHTAIEARDTLIVRGEMEDILAFQEQRGLLLLTDVKLGDAELSEENTVLMEMQLKPGSELVGATLKEYGFRQRTSCFVLALSRIGSLYRDKVASVPLEPWDTLLVFGPRQRVEGLAKGEDFLPLQEIQRRLRRSRRWWIGALAIPLAVTLAVTGAMPILGSSVVAVALLLATRTVRVQQAYRAIDWTVIFLLAALLPMGIAMEQTGLARRIGEGIVALGAPLGPWAVLALMVLVVSVLTEILTNNSVAVLMTPIAVSVAAGLGVDPKPFLMGICFGASMSFATPTGYQTNTMVYGPGGYRFTDYLRVGLPLNLVFWLLTSALVPLIWEF